MINLRQRSAFSFRHAFGQLPEVMDCVGSDYAALTDRASTFGHIRWSELCKKHGKRPIFGVELGVFEHFAAKKSPSFYATFLATKSVEKINEIFSAATERFKYEPRLSYDDLSSFCDLGNGIVILGDRCNFDLLHPGDNIFLGVHVGTPNIVVKKASALGFKLVAVGENVYPTPFDRDAYEVLTGRNSSSQSYPQHILTRDEWLIAWGREAWAQEALDNQMLIAGQCVAELKKAKLYVPQHSSDLLEMCEAGAATKGVDLTDPAYAERLEREISVIRAKSFADYFYIIADLMKFAKANMFCGPARGSSCGSLVCYLLDITTVDPIKFDLIFERFIDLNRSDLPDIDIDLSDEKRHLVFDYLKSKYGVDNVAQLGTIAFYKSASTINEVCGALGISKYDDVVSKFTTTVEDRDEGHPRVNDCIADALAGEAGKRLLAKFPEFSIAKRIEGHPRHYSRHAAGVIITSEPILSHVAVDRKTFSTQCEKRDAEKSDMLKIDLLGLIQLSIFDHAIELLGKPRDWLLNYPLDDPEAFRIFNSGHLTGVFQFAGNALREMTKKVNVENFEDIVSLTSLARPGPMQSGGADQWIKCKTGVSEIIYDHPSLEPILRNTYGCVVFQEQVMRICREIGQMEWTDVSALRKAMGKTMGVEYFDKWRDKFIPGALATGFSKDDAEWFWRKLCENGSYLFNRSHAVAYSHISYWCAILKARHPTEFAAATLSAESDNARIIALLKDLDREGISYVPFDAGKSKEKWTVIDDKTILGPLSGIKNIGPAAVKKIIDYRENRGQLTKSLEALLKNPVTAYDSIRPIHDRFPDVFERPFDHGIASKITPIEELTENENNRTVVVIAEILKLNDRDKNDPYQLEKRNGKVFSGKTRYLSMNVSDDTSSIYVNVSTRDYDDLAQEFLERGVEGRPVYILRGRIGPGYRLIHLERKKFLGFLDIKKQQADMAECA